MKTYLVGGAVRDILLGQDPKDLDYVVTGSSPGEMLNRGFKQVGADFPVFLHPDTGEEYALARTERKTGAGYNGFDTYFAPDVTIEEDLGRRDLTINAMAMNEDGNLIDPYHGKQDLQTKVLRHTTEAFAEDPVRVLRLARFHARFGPEWIIAWDTLDLCRLMVDRGDLNHLTKERVWKELEKALGEPHPELFFQTLAMFGALEVLFPEIGELDWVVDHLDSNGRPGKTKYQYVGMTLAMTHPEAFEKRLNVPNEYVAYRKMTYRLWDSYTEHPVDRLYSMDAYRNPDLAIEVLEDEKIPRDLLGVFAKTRSLGFDDLPVEERLSARGLEIGRAIKRMRKKAV